jgi:hypothetical protein
MNTTTLLIVLRAGYDILSQKNQDLDYIQVILNLLEIELESPCETDADHQSSAMVLYRRLFRYYQKVAQCLMAGDADFELPEMRIESRLTQYLRQVLIQIGDPERPAKTKIVLTPEEVAALTTLRETARRLREFEAMTQQYDFLESSTFRYKPIPALAQYATSSHT